MQAEALIKRLMSAALNVYDEHEARTVAYYLADSVFGVGRSRALAFPEHEVSADAERLEQVCRLVEQSCPIQYILGHEEFCGLDFRVNRDVLIPRPETQELVDWVRQSSELMKEGKQSGERLHILDIGTGSGTIAVSLSHFVKDAVVEATDISEGALQTARTNAENNGAEVTFLLHDILKEQLPLSRYDIIVSNPPYIPVMQKSEMRSNVLLYEPHAALFVTDDDPLLFYRIIAQKALTALRQGGCLFFEINESYGGQTCDMLARMGYVDVECRDDMNDKPRMIRCVRN